MGLNRLRKQMAKDFYRKAKPKVLGIHKRRKAKRAGALNDGG